MKPHFLLSPYSSKGMELMFCNGQRIIKCVWVGKDVGAHLAARMNAGLTGQCHLASATRPGMLPPYLLYIIEDGGDGVYI